MIERVQEEMRRQRGRPADIGAGATGAPAAGFAWHRLLEWVPLAVIAAGPAGTIVVANSAAEELFGYARSHLIGQRPQLVVPAWSGEHHRAADDDGGDDGRSAGELVDLHGRHRDGTRIPIAVRFGRVVSHEGLLVASAIRDLRTHSHRFR